MYFTRIYKYHINYRVSHPAEDSLMSFFCLLVKSCHLIWKTKVLRRLDLRKLFSRERGVITNTRFSIPHKNSFQFSWKRILRELPFFAYKWYTFYWVRTHMKKKILMKFLTDSNLKALFKFSDWSTIIWWIDQWGQTIQIV